MMPIYLHTALLNMSDWIRTPELSFPSSYQRRVCNLPSRYSKHNTPDSRIGSTTDSNSGSSRNFGSRIGSSSDSSLGSNLGSMTDSNLGSSSDISLDKNFRNNPDHILI